MTNQRGGTGDSDAPYGAPPTGETHSKGEHAEPHLHVPAEPNTRPGPTDEGGHGGMATREQEARERRKQLAAESGEAESS